MCNIIEYTFNLCREKLPNTIHPTNSRLLLLAMHPIQNMQHEHSLQQHPSMSRQLAVSRRSFAALRRLSSPLRLHVGRRSRQRRTALQALAVSHAPTPVRGWHSSCPCGATTTTTTSSKLDEDDDAEPWTQKWNRPDIIHDAQWEKNLWRRDQLAASEAARNEGRVVQQEGNS